jgi:hypothetical protein
MVDVVGRIDTAHGEAGAHLPKIAPELWGLTLDDVDGIPAGTGTTESHTTLMAPDRNVEEVLNDPVGGSTEHPIPEGGEEEPFDDGTGADLLAESKAEAEANADGSADAAADGGGDANMADDSELLSKSALRALGKEGLVDYATKRNIDCEGANMDQIIAALYGE